ncbi:MAG TPA: hypothetical protein VHO69_04780 [Phototrophicaceae bacterium]|nr:hypothetical protein [Phototrophicaceae bacterium]
MGTIIGVFDSDVDLEQALKLLNQAGFKDDLHVIDPARSTTPKITDEAYLGGIGAANSPVVGGSTTPTPYVAPFINTGDPQLDPLGLLDEFRLSADEADYYTQQLRRGGKLIVVETQDDHDNFVRSVMRQNRAQQWTGKDAR